MYVHTESETIAWTVTFAAVGVLATVINILTLYIFFITTALRTRKHLMIINLAVTDFLFGAAGIPAYVIYLLRPTIISLYTLLVVTRFLKTASLLTLGVIAVERMHATVWPIRHKVLSTRAFRVAIVFVWICTPVCTMSVILQTAEVWRQFFLSTGLISALTIGVIAAIVSCYVIIWISFQRRKRRQLGVSTNRDKALAVTLLLVTGTFIVTWAPPMLYFSIVRVCKNCIQPNGKTLGWVVLVFAIQSLINPIIYCFRLPIFKVSVKAVVKRIICLRCFQPNDRTLSKQSAIHPEHQVVQEL